jgi:hypothetical protein
MESLFSLTTSEDLHIMSTLPSSLLFISEVLTERAPDVNWTEFLQREMRNRGM